jgi:hypothetical protein
LLSHPTGRQQLDANNMSGQNAVSASAMFNDKSDNNDKQCYPPPCPQHIQCATAAAVSAV